MASTIGYVLGAFVGMVFIGGLAGWAIKRVFKTEWITADGAGLLIVALLGSVTASSGTWSSYAEYATVYLIAAIPAFFVLRKLRETNLKKS